MGRMLGLGSMAIAYFSGAFGFSEENL